MGPREFEVFGGQIQLQQSFFFAAIEASNMAHPGEIDRY